MKICCTSDLHGFWPEIPDCDLLILAGDYAPAYKHEPGYFYRLQMKPWLRSIHDRGIKIVGIAGNHELLFESHPNFIPKMDWQYLQDSGCEVNGLRIWGTPWQPRFHDWAFNLDEPDLAEKWELIPSDTDILIVHGPPHGFGDYSHFGHVHCGSPSLLSAVLRIKPKLVVAGHIHSGHGVLDLFGTKVINCSYLDDNYKPAFKPIVLELDCPVTEPSAEFCDE